MMPEKIAQLVIRFFNFTFNVHINLTIGDCQDPGVSLIN